MTLNPSVLRAVRRPRGAIGIFVLACLAGACGPETPAPRPIPPVVASTTVVAEEAPPPRPPFAGPPKCSESGYCWESPSHLASPLNAVWAPSAQEIFAVGRGGRIVVRKGEVWSVADSGVGDDLAFVWGIDAEHVIAGGGPGEVLHFEGGVWKKRVLDGRTFLYAVGGTSASDMFVAGNDGALFHFDGEQWQSQKIPAKADFRAIWGSGPNDVYAVGDGEGAGVILHKDASGWTESIRLGNSLFGVWGTGPDAVWVAGTNDKDELALWRRDGKTWKPVGLPPGGNGVALSGTAGKPVLLGTVPLDPERLGFGPISVFLLEPVQDRWIRREIHVAAPSLLGHAWSLFGNADGIVVAGGFGLVGFLSAKDVGTAPAGAPDAQQAFRWVAGRSIGGNALRGVFGTSAKDVVAVGTGGALLRFDGETWSPDPAGKGIDFTAIHGAKEVLVASGMKGKALVRRNGAWAPLTSGTTKGLYAVWTTGETTFLGGEAGTILRCVKDKCAPMKSGSEEDILLLYGTSATDVYAVAGSSELLRYDGGSWRRVPGPGEAGVQVVNPRPEPEEGVLHIGGLANDAGGALIVLRSDGTYRVQGQIWTRLGHGRGAALTSSPGEPVRALWGGSGSGLPTVIHRLDGDTWQVESLPCDAYDMAGLSLRALWSGDGEVFAVGDAGAILHRKR